MWRTLFPVLGIAALAAAAPPAAEAQSVDGPEARGYFDYYVSRFRPAGGSGGPEGLDAVGGRLMWSAGALLRAPESGWLARTRVGAYVAHTGEEAEKPEAWRYGAQIDLPVPLEGRVEPILSLAAGAVRTVDPGMWMVSVPYVARDGDGRARMPIPLLRAELPDRVTTAASLIPGVGVRIRIAPWLHLRSDARQVIDFHADTARQLELSGGISLGV